MTYPSGGRRRANETDRWGGPIANPDPLTDSGVHRMMLGTRVTLHTYKDQIEVGLTAIKDVATWNDLAERITHGLPIEVMASRRRAFAGGVVLWAEVSSDPVEEKA